MPLSHWLLSKTSLLSKTLKGDRPGGDLKAILKDFKGLLSVVIWTSKDIFCKNGLLFGVKLLGNGGLVWWTHDQ